MAVDTAAEVEPYVIRYYRGNRIEKVRKPSSPLFQEIPKNPNGRGEYRASIEYGSGSGVSGDISTAQTNTGATANERFQFDSDDYADFHGVVRISNKIMKSSENGGMVARTFTKEADAKIRRITRVIQIGIANDAIGANVFATIASVSTAIYTLASAAEVRRFQKGDNVVMAETTTGALRDSGTAKDITDIDPSGPTITLSAAITGAVATDFVYLEGLAPDNGTTRWLFGVPAWIPTTAPGSTAFFTVDRTSDTEALGGFRTDGSTVGTQTEAITLGASELFDGTQGAAKPTKCFMPVDKWKLLVLELTDRGILTGTDAKFGYAFIEHAFGPYRIRCIPEPENASGRAYMLDMSTWELVSLGGLPYFETQAGSRMILQSASAGIEARLDAFPQLMCGIPGYNNNINLP